MSRSTWSAQQAPQSAPELLTQVEPPRRGLWAQWSAPFRVAGELIGLLFGRRVRQLAIPTRPLETAHGVDSRVTHVLRASGGHHASGWLRTLAATGAVVYSGCYSARRPPGADRPSVHVAFPLESGNVQVFLRPAVGPAGSLVLSSPAGPFGSPAGPFGTDGAYVVVRGPGRRASAARVPIHERFQVYRDRRGVLRTDHELSWHRAVVLRLHYRLDPDPGARDAST